MNLVLAKVMENVTDVIKEVCPACFKSPKLKELLFTSVNIMVNWLGSTLYI